VDAGLTEFEGYSGDHYQDRLITESTLSMPNITFISESANPDHLQVVAALTSKADFSHHMIMFYTG
jgi:hypothetical protein